MSNEKVEVSAGLVSKTNGGTLTGNYTISSFDDHIKWDKDERFVNFTIIFSQYYSKKKEYGPTQSLKCRYWLDDNESATELKKMIVPKGKIRIIDSFLSLSFKSTKDKNEHGDPKTIYFTQLNVYKFETKWRDNSYNIINFKKGNNSSSNENNSSESRDTVVEDDDNEVEESII